MPRDPEYRVLKQSREFVDLDYHAVEKVVDFYDNPPILDDTLDSRYSINNGLVAHFTGISSLCIFIDKQGRKRYKPEYLPDGSGLKEGFELAHPLSYGNIRSGVPIPKLMEGYFIATEKYTEIRYIVKLK